MLSSDDEINDELLQRVIQAGHSRVPVYAQNNKQVGHAGRFGASALLGYLASECTQPPCHCAQVGLPGKRAARKAAHTWGYSVAGHHSRTTKRQTAMNQMCGPLHMQAILGVVLIKELVLVDEDIGVRVGELRIRDAPFIRQATVLWV